MRYHCFQQVLRNQGRVEAFALLVESLSGDADLVGIFVRSGDLVDALAGEGVEVNVAGSPVAGV